MLLCVRILRPHVGNLCRLAAQQNALEGRMSILQRKQFHGDHLKQKERSANVGNKHFVPHIEEKKAPPRWKHLWLLMMKRKAEIEGAEAPRPRSDQINWNYEAELCAFAKRLGIRASLSILQTAFTEPMLSSDHAMQNNVVVNNSELVRAGQKFSVEFLHLYFQTVFPQLPEKCVGSCIAYLTSKRLLAHIARNLGFYDLVQTPHFPVHQTALARCFMATLAAILHGEGGHSEAGRFILDFVVAQLTSKDIVHDILRPQNPMGLLVEELQSRNLPLPEARLMRMSGVNTTTPIYFVGIFSEKRLLAESGGETIIKAETDAAKLALKKFYDVSVDVYLPNFNVLQDPVFVEKLHRLAKAEDREKLISSI